MKDEHEHNDIILHVIMDMGMHDVQASFPYVVVVVVVLIDYTRRVACTPRAPDHRHVLADTGIVLEEQE